jgi:hypothetical protein
MRRAPDFSAIVTKRSILLPDRAPGDEKRERYEQWGVEWFTLINSDEKFRDKRSSLWKEVQEIIQNSGAYTTAESNIDILTLIGSLAQFQ